MASLPASRCFAWLAFSATRHRTRQASTRYLCPLAFSSHRDGLNRHKWLIRSMPSNSRNGEGQEEESHGQGGADDWDVAWRSLQQRNGKTEVQEGRKQGNEVGETVPTSIDSTDDDISTLGRKDSSFLRGGSGGSFSGSGGPLQEGPMLTRWGGRVRSGRYGLGSGADVMLGLWGNGDAMLIAAMAVICLLIALAFNFPPPPDLTTAVE
eukprot:TRINITY_DN10164_c0_g2_i1.p1 TRINITY_DN10164_c0_g2~~TRINITY_DN10164_c0_g2_i1.p1  ORF type:complete len:216 (-),score=48.67 TRINITY_DN10164_c0_g2_i1:245-871(-)